MKNKNNNKSYPTNLVPESLSTVEAICLYVAHTYSDKTFLTDKKNNITNTSENQLEILWREVCLRNLSPTPSCTCHVYY